jgi:4-amino-4-deoxy-L-arabinose transferase-like glycosyltransferase
MSDTEAPARRAIAPREGGGAVGPAPVPLAVIALSSVALVAGVVLRFVTRSPLWLDEALSVNIAKLPVSQIPSALRHDGHPPLYYLLLHAWMAVVGSGDVAVRALSGLIALLALPLAWIIGRRRGGPLLGWLFMAVMAMSPFALRYATETRMYSLLMVGTLVLYLLVDDVARLGRGGWLRLIALGLVSGLLLLTHYWSIWLLGAVELVLAWRWWRHPDERHATGRAFLAIAAGGVLFVPWVPSFLYQAAHTGTPWAGRVRPTNLLGATIQDVGGGAFKDAILVGAVMVALGALGLFGRGIDERHIDLDLRTRRFVRYEAVVLTLTLAIGALVGLLTASTYATRYASGIFPLFALLVAAGVACFRSSRVLTGVLAAFLAMCLLGAYWNVTYMRSQSRVAGHAINQVAQPGDLVIFCPDQLGPAYSRELRSGLDEMVYPTLGSPKRVDWVDYAKRNAAANPGKIGQQVLARAGSHRIFLVWQGAYRTFGNQCETLFAVLAAARPGARTLVVSGGDQYFEPAAVVAFPPRR